MDVTSKWPTNYRHLSKQEVYTLSSKLIDFYNVEKQVTTNLFFQYKLLIDSSAQSWNCPHASMALKVIHFDNELAKLKLHLKQVQSEAAIMIEAIELKQSELVIDACSP